MEPEMEDLMTELIPDAFEVGWLVQTAGYDEGVKVGREIERNNHQDAINVARRSLLEAAEKI